MTNPDILCVIPARYGSTRLPGKPLIDIHGKPLVMWVYDNAVASNAFGAVCVATDDQRILDAVRSCGGAAVMTDSHHQSGTDRACEAAQAYGRRFVVNLQGDEPRLPAHVLRDFTQALVKVVDDNSLLTIVSHATINEKSNPNIVKAVLNERNEALYFSRACIPYDRDGGQKTFLKHTGIYGFTRVGLQRFCTLTPGTLEQCEKLEQLRALERGMRIHCLQRDYRSFGIDTLDDLKEFLVWLETEGSAPNGNT